MGVWFTPRSNLLGKLAGDFSSYLSPASNLSMSFNLYYIRAAIQSRTGQVLKFDRIRQLLLEEGLISKKELKDNPLAHEFDGYGRYFATEEYTVDVPPNPQMLLTELLETEFDEEAV